MAFNRKMNALTNQAFRSELKVTIVIKLEIKRLEEANSVHRKLHT